MAKSLVSVPTLVQSPFIIVTIGGVTFGSYSGNHTYGGRVQYPNYMKSINISKVNGIVNTYTLQFQYKVRTGDDPNLLDKIFSRAAKDREITFEYGDWNAPSYIYKNESAIMTNVTSSLDMSTAMISYTVQATSNAISLTSVSYDFSQRTAKPSDVLKELLSNSKYGLKSVFSGMRNLNAVLNNNLIASNDKKVTLLGQKSCNVLDYMNYLTSSMISTSTPQNSLSNSKYYLTIHDDFNNKIGGTYFKVSEVGRDTKTTKSTDTYEIDVNFPTDNFVTNFTLTNDQQWTILYQFSDKINQEQYSYTVQDNGTVATNRVSSLIKSDYSNLPSPSKSSWWSQVTQFPIEATLTIKGLTRPSILMSYVKLNVLFSGGIKHISSGVYNITKQMDDIDSSGYRTTLTLLRVGADY